MTRDFGPGAVLIEVSGTVEALSLAGHLRESGLPLTDVVPGAVTVLVDGVAGIKEQLGRVLEHWGAATRWDDPTPAIVSVPVEIPVVWNGADLAWVADHWEMSPDDVVATMEQHTLVSAFCGFAPGFAYLAGLPLPRSVPRLARPRPRVPAGSIGLAGTWCGIYPSASPGGWRLLGTTAAQLWDPTKAEPALLAPGTRVRFVRP